MVPFSAGIGEVKHLCVVHVKIGFADNAELPESYVFHNARLSCRDKGLPCMQMVVTG